MKVLCNREQLREGLAIVNGVIPTKSTRPAIENVCLVATENALELVGTDLEVAIRFRIDDVKVADTGTTLIPARVAAEFVRDLSGETASIDATGDNCVITSEGDRIELVTIDPDEFPVISRFQDEHSYPILAETFNKQISRTGFAAAREPGRYAMHGILIEVETGHMRMVATDGRRLAVTTTLLDCPEDKAHRAIVPTKGLQMFARLLGDPMARVRVAFEETQFCLKTDQAEIFARLIDGDFPKYNQVVPAEGSCKIEADASQLVGKLRLASTVTSADARAVKLVFTEDHLEILAKATGRGRASGQMEVSYQGTDVDIAFNPDFLIDGLKQCESDRVHLEFNDRTSPGKFMLGQDYTYVVMPITIDT
jgi:DNA polymerase-3 subunit beta